MKSVKVEHVVKHVPVVPHPTVSAALSACSCKSILGSLRQFILSTLRLAQTDEERKLTEIIRQPIWYEFDGRKLHYRTFALASMSRTMTIHEFHEALREKGFRPASINGGAAFIPLLRSRRALPDFVLHLGTPIPDEDFREWFLVTRKNGTVQAVALLPEAKLPLNYKVVVEKRGGT